MKIEVGKVYKCGEVFVYIDYLSTSGKARYSYIGICVRQDGSELYKDVDKAVGRWGASGDYACANPKFLQYWLEEIHKRPTIEILGKVLYLDEYEAAVNGCKEAKPDFNHLQYGDDMKLT